MLIRSQNDAFAQKIIAKTLNNLKISSKIKLTVDVDPINFAWFYQSGLNALISYGNKPQLYLN